jgi:type IV secretion system protein VirB9
LGAALAVAVFAPEAATAASPSPVLPPPLAVARASAPSAGPAAAPSVTLRRAHGRRRAAHRPAVLAAVDRANAQARDVPTPSAYVNSALYYDFEPGRLYTIHTSPRFLTTIQLRPGEKLIAKAAGDTVRWVLGETQAGSGEAAQVIVFVKPIRPDLRTNIVLTTDQRTYLIDAISNGAASYTSVLTWNYPQEAARDLAGAQARLAQQNGTRVAEAISLDRLNFRYRIDTPKGRTPTWSPLRVFDDGTKTFIEFPADLSTRQAPPLFLVGDKGQAELVNYRVSGVYYVVDRLVDRAELRLGQGRQSVVRITRTGARG